MTEMRLTETSAHVRNSFTSLSQVPSAKADSLQQLNNRDIWSKQDGSVKYNNNNV